MLRLISNRLSLITSLFFARRNQLFSCLALLAVAQLLYSWRKRRITARALEQKKTSLKALKQRLHEKLSTFSLSAEELMRLTDRDLKDLRKQIVDGQIKPIDLLHAFQIKALHLVEDGNHGIAEFLEEADEWANTLSSQSPHSPLYGIPVSVKESVAVAGHDATFGLANRIGKPISRDCVIVQVLRSCGAIPFVLTASSQALLSMDGDNPITGDMMNPYSPRHTPGGSSSGEAILVGMSGSPIGLATDIGGSIRIPAAFCGLCGLKPSALRLSSKGIVSTNQKSVLGLEVSVGPIARSVSDLAVMMQALLTQQMFQLDRSVPPIPFREKIFNGRDKKVLTIGICVSFSHPELIATVPAVREAIRLAGAILKAAGHRIVPFQPPNEALAYKLGLRALFADGGINFLDQLKWENVGDNVARLKSMLGLPRTMKRALGWAGKFLIGKPVGMTAMLEGVPDTMDALKLQADIKKYREQFAKAWDDAGYLDALICPPSAFPAPPRGTKSLLTFPSIAYSLLFNLIDYPAGVIPIGMVDRRMLLKTREKFEKLYLDWDSFAAKIHSFQAGSEGLPLSVQVVGAPWCEERVLRVMRELEDGLKKYFPADGSASPQIHA